MSKLLKSNSLKPELDITAQNRIVEPYFKQELLSTKFTLHGSLGYLINYYSFVYLASIN